MDDAIRSALKTQYHAAFAMLLDRVSACPEELWTGGEFPRSFWRIAYHAAFYGELYLQNKFDDFKPWEKHRENAPSLFEDAEDMAPYDREEVLQYATDVKSRIDGLIESAELARDDSGFYWYDMPKLDHLVLGLRHVMEHVGQLGERLITAGIDIEWRSCSRERPC